MSEEQKAPDAGVEPQKADNPAETIKNLKAEYERKYSNLENMTAELKRSIDSLKAATAPKMEAKSAEEDNLSDLLYKDPEQYTKKLEERAERRVMQRIQADTAKQNRVNTTLTQLVQEFPELQDHSHDFTKRANEIYNSLSADEQSNPLSYRYAVKEAAVELGVKPRSKRPAEEQEFSGFGGSSRSKERAPSEKAFQMTDLAKEVAIAGGLDINDPKVVKRIQERAKNIKFKGDWIK